MSGTATYNRAYRALRRAQGYCTYPGCWERPREGRVSCATHAGEAQERDRQLRLRAQQPGPLGA